MNKAQLVEALSTRLGEDKKRIAATVDALLDTVYRTVQKGEKVALTGFGVFEKRDRAARTARNPATGEKVRVKKTSVPAFRAGQEFKNVVNGSKKLPKVAPAKAAATATGDDHADDGAHDGGQDDRGEGSGEEDRGQVGAREADDGEGDPDHRGEDHRGQDDRGQDDRGEEDHRQGDDGAEDDGEGGAAEDRGEKHAPDGNTHQRPRVGLAPTRGRARSGTAARVDAGRGARLSGPRPSRSAELRGDEPVAGRVGCHSGRGPPVLEA